MRIAAVVVGAGPAAAAVARQTRPPDRLAGEAGSAHHAARAAAPSDDWLWLVAGDTEPEPDALEALADVAAGRDGLPPPVLLASRVVGPDGRLDPGAAPWPVLDDRPGAMLAAEHRLAAVRLAHWGSLMVSTAALRRHGAPRARLAGAGDDLEWTARLLRDSPGYLVPGSVARRREPPAPRTRQLLGVAATLAGDGLDAQERLWLLYASLLEGSRPRPSRNPRAIVARLSALPRFARR